MTPIRPHPLAEIFPAMTNQEFKDLVEDVKRQGLLSPITLYEGKILDGRHRYRACIVTGTKARFEEYKKSDPLAFVVSHNLKRRNLTAGQLAMIASKMANMPRGKPEAKSARVLISQTEAAETLGVSTRSVSTAAKITRESPALAAQVQGGKISLNAATKTIADSKGKPAVPEPKRDKEGYQIPVKLIPLWERAEAESKGALDLVVKLRSAFKEAAEQEDIIFRELDFQENVGLLTSLFGNIKRIAPYAVCTLCQGMLPDRCELCKGRGFLSQFAWKMYGDDRAKVMRKQNQK